MKTYVEVLQEAIPGLTAHDLNIPFSESSIHSLDSIILRDALENYFGFEIPDTTWLGFNNLSEALGYCNFKRGLQDRPIVPDAKINTQRSQEIKMPQMANSALSENWLLKEMGDMHWEMLSHGLNQKSSEFTDSQGNRLYAAFVRVSYSIDPLNDFHEHEILQLKGAIKRYGNYAYYSSVKGECNGKSLKANLMTSFSARKANDNSQITKSNPEENVNHVEELERTPEFYNEHRLFKKGLINGVQSGKYYFKNSNATLESSRYTINPHFEINGVGLLYFASYPIIADTCASEFFKTTMEMKDYDSEYHTVHRDIFYFANCNASDRIIIKLNDAQLIDDNKLKMTVSMYRESDNKLMAKLFTVKQKAQ